MTQSVAVLDTGAGNLHSVVRALRAAAPEANVRVCSRLDELLAASHVVLPGQGAMRDCMARVLAAGERETLDTVLASRPVFGVCVGMQLLFERSDETGGVDGVGRFPGQVVRFEGPAFAPQADGQSLKVPHMGWNPVWQTRAHPFWTGVPDGTPFYFVHSYYLTGEPEGLALGQTRHGVDFTSVVAADNIVAVQFHPEKSAAAGLRLYENFLRWNP